MQDGLREIATDADRPGSNRSFGLVFGGVFTLIAAWLAWKHVLPEAGVALLVAVGFLLAAFIAPDYLSPLNWLWHRFGLLLHHIISPVVMGLLYLITIVPTGLVMRALKKDILRLKFDPNAQSYWVERTPPGPPSDSLKNQF